MAGRRLTERANSAVSVLARSFQRLRREQLSCGPVTVQQCYTLSALADEPRSMKALAADVGLHQSTLTRVVEKLERQKLLRRRRNGDDQRTVQVELTDSGRRLQDKLQSESLCLVGALLDGMSKQEQDTVVKGLEVLARTLDPHGNAFRTLLD